MVYYLFRLDPDDIRINSLLGFLESKFEQVDYVPSKRRIVCASAINADRDIIAFLNGGDYIIFESHSKEIRLEYQYNKINGIWDAHTLIPLLAPEAIMNL